MHFISPLFDLLLTTTGDALYHKMEQVLAGKADALVHLEQFKSSLDCGADILSQWRAEIRMWERDKSGRNPYDRRVACELVNAL